MKPIALCPFATCVCGAPAPSFRSLPPSADFFFYYYLFFLPLFFPKSLSRANPRRFAVVWSCVCAASPRVGQRGAELCPAGGWFPAALGQVMALCAPRLGFGFFFWRKTLEMWQAGGLVLGLRTGGVSENNTCS